VKARKAPPSAPKELLAIISGFNPDLSSLDDLRETHAKLVRLDRRNRAVDLLIKYLGWTIPARECREEGLVSHALDCEAKRDALFVRMPAWMRW